MAVARAVHGGRCAGRFIHFPVRMQIRGPDQRLLVRIGRVQQAGLVRAQVGTSARRPGIAHEILARRDRRVSDIDGRGAGTQVEIRRDLILEQRVGEQRIGVIA